jgi:hypothetical protein
LLNTTTLCYKKVFPVARIDILLCCYNTTTHGKTRLALLQKTSLQQELNSAQLLQHMQSMATLLQFSFPPFEQHLCTICLCKPSLGIRVHIDPSTYGDHTSIRRSCIALLIYGIMHKLHCSSMESYVHCGVDIWNHTSHSSLPLKQNT